jgi:uncharacterized membrane protein
MAAGDVSGRAAGEGARSESYVPSTYDFDLDGYFAEGTPGNQHAATLSVDGVREASIGQCAYKMVINAANQSSCALSSACASVLHRWVLVSYMSPVITKTHVAWPQSVSDGNSGASRGFTYCETEPADEAMVPFEYVVVLAAQNG